MAKYLHSKWSSAEKLNGWKHYEVKNVFLKNKELEIFPVCDKEISSIIKIADLSDNKKWIAGWQNY